MHEGQGSSSAEAVGLGTSDVSQWGGVRCGSQTGPGLLLMLIERMDGGEDDWGVTSCMIDVVCRIRERPDLFRIVVMVVHCIS